MSPHSRSRVKTFASSAHDRNATGGIRPTTVQACVTLAILTLTACGGGSGTIPTYAVGGTVSGLQGSGLILANEGADPLRITQSGPFVFPTRLADGSAYAITVLAQPSSPVQNCVVLNV